MDEKPCTSFSYHIINDNHNNLMIDDKCQKEEDTGIINFSPSRMYINQKQPQSNCLRHFNDCNFGILSSSLLSKLCVPIYYYYFKILLFLCLFSFSLGQENNVVGEPFISCAADAIYAKWKTNKTFTGHVNVRYAPNRFCYQVLVTNNQIELLVPHQECQVNRIRSLSPPGLILETNVLISFHPQFVTGDDRIYVLKCLHNRPSSKKKHGNSDTLLLTEGIPFDKDFGSNSTESTSIDEQHLKCGYNITNENGEIIDDAAVGDTVKHQWWCLNAPVKSCLIVTNCFLKTYDSEHNLIGKDGCSSDIRVMPQLVYNNETLVETNLRVFGVAQRPIVHYQCQLNLIPAMDDGTCPLPVCTSINPIRKRRDVVSYLSSDSAISFDAVSQEIEVLQPGSPPRKPKCSEATKIERYIPEGSICVSKIAFCLVSVATITVAIITLGLLLFYTIQHVHYSGVPSTTN